MFDFDRLQPLRVATGSHRRGSGRGCAMNVVSYITGETMITDLPACSDVDLARLVQGINDKLGELHGTPVWDSRGDKYLTSEDAQTVIELGVLTIGTNPPRGATWSIHKHPELLSRVYDICAMWISVTEADIPDLVSETRELLLEIRRALGLDEVSMDQLESSISDLLV